ncbi:hypothetical protein D0867_15981 [Hortaea werneckii]|uniref:Uncharacterized protein n=1 Tax=Hortaea werneckii TaxID=91943 RepID=A0A3M6X0N5_HORWE|nr:hypothetical protein D0867_15981 [Hortaea werneckii]
MSTNDEAVVIQPDDHKRSYGRGGAGNMRLPSVVAAAQDEPELAKEAGLTTTQKKSMAEGGQAVSARPSRIRVAPPLGGKARSWINYCDEGRRMRKEGKMRKVVVGMVNKRRTDR